MFANTARYAKTNRYAIGTGKIRHWAAGENPPDARTIAAVPPKKPDGRDVYVYFDNDVKVRAPFDAMSLADKLVRG